MRSIEAHAFSYLREDVHWGSDLDVLKSAIRGAGDSSRYLDLGCGPGFHSNWIAETYPRISVVGVDLSVPMLTLAESRARHLTLRNVRFVHAELSTYQDNNRYDIVSCLNNTLNNLCDGVNRADSIRQNALVRMRELLRLDGQLILSVYNKDKLRLENYRRVCTVLPESKPDEGELFLEWGDGELSERHYSHWSTEEEVLMLLEQSGFQVELLEKRLARIVVSARRN